jgi:replicative DNA helicase
MTRAYGKTTEESKAPKTPVAKKGNGSGNGSGGNGSDDQEQEKHTFNFAKPFQEKILGLMVQDHDFLAYAAPRIKPEHFTSKTLVRISAIIQDIYSKHKCGITHPTLTNEIKKLVKAKKIEKDDLKVYAKTLKQMFKPLPDAEYVRSEVKQFVIHMNTEVAIVKAVDHHKKGEYEQIGEVIHTSIQEALFHSSKDYNPLDGKYLKECLIQRADMAEHPEKFRGISTGIPPLDGKLYWRGVGKKELAVVMAPTNGGKSPFLLHVAAAAALEGHTVIFYTLELDQYFIDLRLQANLTGIQINDLAKLYPEDVEKKLKKRLKGCKGQLLVHDLSSLTPAMVECDLVAYKKKGIFPDLIVIDSAEEMTPDTRSKERRHEFSSIYQGLRAIAKKENVAVWTASQANRASYRKSIIKLDDVAEDWGKVMIADYVVGLCQTETEAKYKPQKMRLFLAKNRNGEKGIVVETRVDFARMRMHVVVSAEDAEKEKEMYGSMKEKVKELIKRKGVVEEMTKNIAEEIAEEVGCTDRYVYDVKKGMKDAENPTD